MATGRSRSCCSRTWPSCRCWRSSRSSRPGRRRRRTTIPLLKAGIALAAIAALVVVGHYLLRPLFHIIAASKADEIFTAAALLVVIGAAMAMQMAGLSMALGAFLAGVLLAESEFRHQLETDIEPFRGLLLGLLFIAVGMSVAWPLVAEYWATVVFGALGHLRAEGGC